MKMSKELNRRIAKIEQTNKPQIGCETETSKLLKEYNLMLVEFRKLPLEEQSRLEKLENEQVLEWYVNLKGGKQN